MGLDIIRMLGFTMNDGIILERGPIGKSNSEFWGKRVAPESEKEKPPVSFK